MQMLQGHESKCCPPPIFYTIYMHSTAALQIFCFTAWIYSTIYSKTWSEEIQVRMPFQREFDKLPAQIQISAWKRTVLKKLTLSGKRRWADTWVWPSGTTLFLATATPLKRHCLHVHMRTQSAINQAERRYTNGLREFAGAVTRDYSK